MHDYPTFPPLADVPELLDGGHLWIQERVSGGPLRFAMSDAGVLQFGDDRRPFRRDDVPPPYRHAVREVTGTFDRAGLRSAVSAVEAITFAGVATFRADRVYDWRRLPGFLGIAIHDADRGDWLPIDHVERIYRELGLEPLNALQKEVRAVDFDPDRYEWPNSAWGDGEVSGVLLRNKRGLAATLSNPTAPEPPTVEPASGPTAEIVSEWLPQSRLRRALEGAGKGPRSVDTGRLADRLVAAVEREHHREIEHHESTVEREELRPAIIRLLESVDR